MRIAKSQILLQEVSAAALLAADPSPRVTRALQKDGALGAARGVLNRRGAPGLIAAVGKAAGQMLRGALCALGQSQAEIFCVTKDGHPTVPGVKTCFAGHPLPDERSVIAAEALLQSASRLGASGWLLLLLSGGASALLCAPRPPLTLAEKRQITDLLLRAGAPIEEINTIRKFFSRIKGGGLWRKAAPAETFGLVLSDVVSGTLCDVGSGPLSTRSPSPAEVQQIFTRYGLLGALPESARSLLAAPYAHKPPSGPAPVLTCVGDRSLLLEGARHALEARGVRCRVLDANVKGPVEDLVEHFTKYTKSEEVHSEPLALLAVGEPTVRPTGTGRGGRAQHAALLLAHKIQGRRGLSFLALGSDGTDGPTDAAGALVNGETWEAIRRGGINPEEALASFNSEEAHRVAGTRLITGPTGTNVNDLYILLLEPSGV